MQSLVDEINGSWNPYKMQGRTATEIENFSKTIKNINKAMRDVGRFLESSPMFSNF